MTNVQYCSLLSALYERRHNTIAAVRKRPPLYLVANHMTVALE